MTTLRMFLAADAFRQSARGARRGRLRVLSNHADPIADTEAPRRHACFCGCCGARVLGAAYCAGVRPWHGREGRGVWRLAAQGHAAQEAGPLARSARQRDGWWRGTVDQGRGQRERDMLARHAIVGAAMPAELGALASTCVVKGVKERNIP